MTRVKEGAEKWAAKEGIIVTESQMIRELQAENDKLKGLFERIQTWAKAYPLDIFPKPDLKKAAKVLKASGMSLDAISADNMRHVLDGIKDITAEALERKPQ